MAERGEEKKKSAAAERKGGQKAAPKGAQETARRAEAAASEEAKANEPKVPARLRKRLEKEIAPLLMRELKIENRFRVPRLLKIVINMGLKDARENVKLLDGAIEELGQLTGQRAVITRARTAISNFKLRRGMPIGVMVTLRRERMYEFFDRLVNIALPRVRDFRGVSDKAFDGRGNYSLGIREHTIFPELNLDKIEAVKGMTVSIITTARSDFEGYVLLRALGMPFRGAGGARDLGETAGNAGQA